MKVAIEARALTGSSGGVKRYVQNLVKGISQLPSVYDLSVILDKTSNLNIKGAKPIVVNKYGKIGFGYWLNFQIPKELSTMKTDIVHYTKADVPRKKVIPTVVTIYDVIPLLYPNSQKFLDGIYWQKALYRAAAKSDKIITISQNSKRDIVRELDVPEEKVVVTRLGIDKQKFTFSDVTQKEHPYILYVGTIEPRKNVASLIKSFSLIKDNFPHKLVIVGRKYKGYELLEQLAAKEDLTDRIEWKDYVDDKELIKLYNQASLFVWPSIYEGWGFPPQEAMACGTPVIVSNGGALPEVVGEAGIIVKFSSDNVKDRDNDSQFTKKLAQEMETVLESEQLQRSMRAKGKIQAARYTWDSVVSKTLAVYKEVLK